MTRYIIASVERTKKNTKKSSNRGRVAVVRTITRTYNRVLYYIVANVRRVLGSPHLSGGGDNDTPTYPPHAQSVPTASGRNNPRASLVFAYLTVYNTRVPKVYDIFCSASAVYTRKNRRHCPSAREIYN